jgi:hypothetical protein
MPSPSEPDDSVDLADLDVEALAAAPAPPCEVGG